MLIFSPMRLVATFSDHAGHERGGDGKAGASNKFRDAIQCFHIFIVIVFVQRNRFASSLATPQRRRVLNFPLSKAGP
jgi:hypothetical protein